MSPGLTAGKAMLIDSSATELLIVAGFSVTVGYVDDDFTRNLVTLLGEVRIIPTYRAVGAARYTTPKA